MQIVIYYAPRESKTITNAKKQADKAGISMSRLVLNALESVSDRKPSGMRKLGLPSAEGR